MPELHPQSPPEEVPWTIDELIRNRASSNPDVPLIAYPTITGVYVDYTAKQLDRYAFEFAQSYQKRLRVRANSLEPPNVVALLGASDINYVLATLALSKIGMTVLFLSTRISDAAYLSLLEQTGCRDLVIDEQSQDKAQRLQASNPRLNIVPILKCEKLSFPHIDVARDTAMDHHLDKSAENTYNAWIIHSSGSTGLPKPIYQTHAAALRNYANNFNLRGFITLPLYHAHGLSSVFRAIHSQKQIHIYSASLPLTGRNLLDTMTKHKFEIFYGVPYALKLLSETDQGLDTLRELKLVMFGGSSCPDALGDKLVRYGVNLISHYGTTETGQLMTSFRGDGDKDWNYLRVSKTLEPFIRWEERGGGLFELVVLPGWPSKVATNRDDGAYATKDLFSVHPDNSNAFKWSGRLDDTLVLVNGEKAIPIPIEHTVRENAFVAEAVVFGSGKPLLGMLVVPSGKTRGMSHGEIMQQILPSVQIANADQPAYAQISPEMIRILAEDTAYPKTDKDTVMRAAFYNKFKDPIERVYADYFDNTTGAEEMNRTELTEFLTAAVAEVMALENADSLKVDTDFFTVGMDSLQAMRIQLAISKKLNTNGKPLKQNTVFEHPSIQSLVDYLWFLKTGVAIKSRGTEEVMRDLLEKYSQFEEHKPETSADFTNAILVTGATGSLGAHVVAQMVHNASVDKVYCLVRATSSRNAAQRVVESMVQRRVYHNLTARERSKIVSLPSDFSRQDLGLEPLVYNEVTRNVSLVVHLAWAVNFNMGVESFERQHIAGAYNLIRLCLKSKRKEPAAFYFGSSVSAVAASPAAIEERTEPNLSLAQSMGYAQSKLVTENICSCAALKTGMICRVLRIGQIAGDTRFGVWNSTEAIPLIIQSALTIGCLPKLDETPTWLPVDTVAAAITDLCGLSPHSAPLDSVFHVVNPTAFHWTSDLLPALRVAGLSFETVTQKEWVRRLRESNPDPVANPPFKLLEFFAGKYDRDNAHPTKYYKTDLACAHSPSLHSAPRIDPSLVSKFVECWQNSSWAAPEAQSGVLVVAGPCGTGKSTVAKAVAAAFDVPWVDADTLHTDAAISKMANGDPLEDEDRWNWLERVKRRCVGEAAGRAGVVVACSALRRQYRDKLREMPRDLRVKFIMLEALPEELERRLEKRMGHYMKASMVQGQINITGRIQDDEHDMIPLDAMKEKEEVAADAIFFSRSLFRSAN